MRELRKSGRPRSSGFLFWLLLVLMTATACASHAATQVYVADLVGGRIYQLDVSSGISSIYASDPLLQGAVGLARETNGDFLVSTVGSKAVRRIDHVTKAVTTLTSGGFLQNPDGVALLGGELFVADPIAVAIIGVNTATGAQRIVKANGMSGGGPWLCAAPDGFLYVSRNDNSTIVRLNPTTGDETLVASNLFGPGGIGVTPDGYLAVTSLTSEQMLRVNPVTDDQQVTWVFVNGEKPLGLGVSQEGYVWTGLYQTNDVVRVHPTLGAGTVFPVTGMQSPYGVVAVSVGAPPTSPPTGPAVCLASTDRPDSVVFTWASGGGVIDFYQVLRDNAFPIAVSGNVYRYAEKAPKGAHTYCVQAGNLAGLSGSCCDIGFMTSPVQIPQLGPIVDVPADQGGHVTLSWKASDLDVWFGTVTGYSILRLNPGESHSAPIATVPATRSTSYAFDAPTVVDSLPTSNPLTGFLVRALTSNPAVFYDSGFQFGYSVDNLAPAVPLGFQGALLPTGAVQLGWLRSPESDWSDYRLYRGASGDFVPSPTSLRLETPDTSAVDPQGAGFFYKLSAVDVHGNESGFALVRPEDIPVPALIEFFQAETVESGIRVSLNVAGGTSIVGVRLWRSLTESRVGALALTPDAVPLTGTHFEFMDAQAPRQKVWYWADLVGQSGSVSEFGPITAFGMGAFPTTIFFAPQPNPSLGSVEFSYTVGSDQAGAGETPVKLALYDTRGKLVRTLVSSTAPAGSYHQHWDGNDARGARLGTGVYQYKLQVGSQVRSGKVIRL